MKPAGSDSQRQEVGDQKVADYLATRSFPPNSNTAISSDVRAKSNSDGSLQLSLAAFRRQALDHHRAGRLDDALTSYRRLLTLAPHDPGIWSNLGAALRQKKQYQSAVNCYRRALSINPGDLTVIGNLANALKDLQRFEESLALHRQVVDKKPDDVQALMNYASALRESGQFAGALNQLNTAQQVDPSQAGIEWERAQNLLYLGRYREGWKAYEARWRTGDLPQHHFERAQWAGEDIAGKTILLHSEQGYGDTILAARFVRLVKARVGDAGKVLLQCKPELHRLLQSVGADCLVAPGERRPDFDLHCPLMSLMGCLDIQPDTVPMPAELHVPAAARQKFSYLGKNQRDKSLLKVGIVWSGSTTFKNNENRALALEAFLPLAELPGVRLYALQKGPRLDELKGSGAAYYIEDIGSRCDDFADTAAAIEQLDLIVMTDSSVAHLAASLNKPMINLLQYVPYWLYALDLETTPWYPSMQLIRQRRVGDWSDVMVRARERVAELASERC